MNGDKDLIMKTLVKTVFAFYFLQIHKISLPEKINKQKSLKYNSNHFSHNNSLVLKVKIKKLQIRLMYIVLANISKLLYSLLFITISSFSWTIFQGILKRFL